MRNEPILHGVLRAFWVGMVAVSMADSPARAQPEANTLCVQPGDRVELGFPSIPWAVTDPTPKSEYRGRRLFRFEDDQAGTRFRFAPVAGLELVIETDDYEDELKFPSVRFLLADGRLYAWVEAQGQKHQGRVDLVRTLRLRGNEVSRSRIDQIEVRRRMRDCDEID